MKTSLRIFFFFAACQLLLHGAFSASDSDESSETTPAPHSELARCPAYTADPADYPWPLPANLTRPPFSFPMPFGHRAGRHGWKRQRLISAAPTISPCPTPVRVPLSIFAPKDTAVLSLASDFPLNVTWELGGGGGDRNWTGWAVYFVTPDWNVTVLAAARGVPPNPITAGESFVDLPAVPVDAKLVVAFFEGKGRNRPGPRTRAVKGSSISRGPELRGEGDKHGKGQGGKHGKGGKHNGGRRLQTLAFTNIRVSLTE